MRRNFNGALLALVVSSVVVAPAAFAKRGNDLVITDGHGEQVTIKHGLFGNNTTIVKDRLGNGYASKKGLFGTKEQQGTVLGNHFERKKGLFGGSTISGGTIFGDKVTTKKGIFGRRTTTVDVSGSTGLAKSLWAKYGADLMGKKATASPAPSAPLAPNMSAPSTSTSGDVNADLNAALGGTQ